MTNNRIWIELEVSPDAEVNKTRADKANVMFEKLGYGKTFFWNDTKNCYCVEIGGGAFLECVSAGHWFNLDFMAR